MGMSKGVGDGESARLSFLRENRGEIFVYQRGSDSGGMLVKPRFMRDPCFSKQWDKVPVVSESDCWATFKQGVLAEVHRLCRSPRYRCVNHRVEMYIG